MATLNRVKLCGDCGHRKDEHESGWPDDKGCSSGRPANGQTFGSMDWCTCKGFVKSSGEEVT